MRVSDQEMVRLCKKNRTEGYELLFSSYQRYIYSVCYGYAGDKEDALDLTQEVYLKIYRAMQSFDEGKPLQPWIKRITVNTCINHAQRKRPLTEELTESSQIDRSDTPEETAIRQSDTTTLQQALSGLPDRERMAIILRHMNGMSYAEIAGVMNCPLGTVRTYIHRARNMLRDILRHSGIWGDD